MNIIDRVTTTKWDSLDSTELVNGLRDGMEIILKTGNTQRRKNFYQAV
jgi:acyl carrier protein